MASQKPAKSKPPEAWSPLVWLLELASRPLERFLHIEAASGVLLILAAAAALFWANSPWSGSYLELWQTSVSFRVGTFGFERSLEWIVNDGLMAIFFFVVGLEIRREIHQGELSDFKRAALPVAAAAGGMVVPALIYVFLIDAPAAKAGWGIPMATDIAFAVGILTLLGRRVPAALRVLLLALAVIDDLGAIIVIALFYSGKFSAVGLFTALAGFGGILIMQRFGIRQKLAYVFPAVVAWAGVYVAGVHPTIAGVIVGLMTPVKAWLGPEGFIDTVRQDVDELSKSQAREISPADLASKLRHVSFAKREAMSPAESLIQSLHPWVAFCIMPIFALANAGVKLPSGAPEPLALSVALAVAAGLILGKPLGILAASQLALALKIGKLPRGVTFSHLLVLGVVAGIGFTMSLFIAQLAFTDQELLAGAKLGILAASGCTAILGLGLGRVLLKAERVAGAAETADEAERSTEL